LNTGVAVKKMKNFKRYFVLFLAAPLIVFFANTASAQNNIYVMVQTVLASQDTEYVDPQLRSLIGELQTVLRYSSYRLLDQQKLKLKLGETGVVSLPDKRTMKITPLNMKKKRVTLKLLILKNKKQVFQTEIQLLNQNNLVVGGPKHKNGYLLFNIKGSF